jgi:Contractile injection system tape measure protein
MQQSQQHIIQRQILEIDLEGNDIGALALQEKIAQFANDVLPLHLEKLFDQLAPTGRVLRLDNLFVEIAISPKDLENEELLAAAIFSKTMETINAHNGHMNTAPLPDVPMTDQESMATLGQSVVAQLLYFLKNGRLPWNASQNSRQDFEVVLLEVLEEEEIGSEWQRAFQALMISGASRQRLVWQFSEKALVVIADRFIGVKKEQLAENQLLASMLKKNMPKVEDILMETFWELFFDIKEFTKAFDEEYLRRFLSKKTDLQHELVAVLKVAGLQDLAEKVELAQRPLGERLNKPTTVKAREESGEAIFVDNAGLVLLHPFLPAFFQTLGLAKEGQLSDPHRAVHLLQFLATGQTTPAEHLLPLNKLLCGLPLDQPIKQRLKLRKQEKAEALRLLQSAIGLWKALGNSSVENFQGSFLCREGKLTHGTEFGWKLQVAPMAWDLLMNELPWGIGVVKLPWMEEMLWVEWV